jgi:excisionase family DNA binding protein
MSTKGERLLNVSKHPGLNGRPHLPQDRTVPVDPFLTIDELCGLLKVEPATIYQLTYRGKIPHYKIANRLRFRLSEILSWIEEHRVTKILDRGPGLED